MADSTTSALPPASGLTGAEIVAVVQSGQSRRTTLSGIVALAGTGSGSGSAVATGLATTSGTPVGVVAAPPTSGQVLTAQSASGAVWATPAAPGTGTVTSVALSAPSGVFAVSGSPLTGSGTLDLSLETQAARAVFAGPATGTGTPTFRQLVVADVSGAGTGSVTSLQLVAPTGLMTVSGGPVTGSGSLTLTLASVASGLVFASPVSGSGSGSYRQLTVAEVSGAGTGSVSSVQVVAPTGLFTASGGPITGSGSITLELTSTASGRVFASPASGTGTGSYRALAATDVPTLNQDTTGKAGAASGLITASGSGTVDVSASAAPTSGQVLIAGSASGAGWGFPAVPAAVAYASLPAASGATGQTRVVSNANNSVWISNGSIWYPVGGEYVHYSAMGSVTTPLATISGVTSGDFSIPGGAPTIPANILKVGSRVHVSALIYKRGGNAVWGCRLRFGTAGNNTDGAVYSRNNLSINSTASLHLQCLMFFPVVGGYMTTDYTGWSQTATGGFIDRVSNVNVGSGMSFSVGVDIVSASDSFDLVAFQVRVQP